MHVASTNLWIGTIFRVLKSPPAPQFVIDCGFERPVGDLAHPNGASTRFKMETSANEAE